jgi:hypothetical protein
MILHHSSTGIRSIGRPIDNAARARIGMIGLGSIVTLLVLLNAAVSLA